GKTLLSGSTDDTVRLWDVTTGKERVRLEGNPGGVGDLAIAPDSRVIATDSFNGVRLWDVSGQRIQRRLRPGRHYYSLGFSPDGKDLLSVSNDTESAVKLSPDGGVVVVKAGETEAITLREVGGGKIRRHLGDRLRHLLRFPDLFAISPDNTLLAWTDPEKNWA